MPVSFVDQPIGVKESSSKIRLLFVDWLIFRAKDKSERHNLIVNWPLKVQYSRVALKKVVFESASLGGTTLGGVTLGGKVVEAVMRSRIMLRN